VGVVCTPSPSWSAVVSLSMLGGDMSTRELLCPILQQFCGRVGCRGVWLCVSVGRKHPPRMPRMAAAANCSLQLPRNCLPAWLVACRVVAGCSYLAQLVCANSSGHWQHMLCAAAMLWCDSATIVCCLAGIGFTLWVLCQVCCSASTAPTVVSLFCLQLSKS